MRMYILKFVSNGTCMYLYLMGTCIRMRTYILDLLVMVFACTYICWVLVIERGHYIL